MRKIIDLIFMAIEMTGKILEFTSIIFGCTLAVFVMPWIFAFSVGHLLIANLFFLSQKTENTICGFLYFTGLALIFTLIGYIVSLKNNDLDL